MKAKLNTIVSLAALSMLAVSCSAPRYADAQTNGGYYTPQPPPAAQQPQDDDYAYDQGSNVEDQQDVDFNTFYDALSPYGTWENDGEYGQVWVSNEPDFTPYYSNGNWAYSDAGWAWVSNYSWGWAPFHYGRWAFRGHWMWVPGYDWAPAWVSWRTGGDYYGWAPLGPGISIGVGVGYGGYMAPERWNFCPRNYIASGHYNNYCVDRSRNVTIINNTTIINNVSSYRNTRYVAGPQRRDVERYTNTRITAMPIRNAGRPGATTVNRGSIQMYRPTVRPNSNNGGRFGNRPGTQPRNDNGNYRPNIPQQNNRPQTFPQSRPQNAPVRPAPSQQPANQPRRPVRDNNQSVFDEDRINTQRGNNDVALNTPAQRMPEYRQPRQQQANTPPIMQQRPQYQQPEQRQPVYGRPQQMPTETRQPVYNSRPQVAQQRSQIQEARPQSLPSAGRPQMQQRPQFQQQRPQVSSQQRGGEGNRPIRRH